MGIKSGLIWSAVLGGPSSVAASALLLDSIGSLGAVYSFRKLVSAYGGNCATIHESGGNTDQTFGFVSNVIDPAAATFGSGTRTVKTWFDQSGNGLDVTNTTVANQPLFIASGINSLPTARFDGSNDDLTKTSVAATTLLSADQMTFLMVLNTTSQTAGLAVTWNAANVDDEMDLWTQRLGGIRYSFGSDNLGNPGQLDLGDDPSDWVGVNHVFEGYRAGDPGTQEMLYDGTSLKSQSRSSGVSGTGDLIIGSGGAAGNNYLGDISEIVILKNDTGSTNRATIRKNGVGPGVAASMGTYYGITVV